MITSTQAANRIIPALAVVAMAMSTGTAFAQEGTGTCKSPQVIPLTAIEPAPKIVVEAPLAQPLASRGVVVIPYCAEHLRIASIFGAGALDVSPRVGHIHVTVDDAAWHWADASGSPVILRGLPPGPHKVLLELVDANHEPLDKAAITFVVPAPRTPEA